MAIVRMRCSIILCADEVSGALVVRRAGAVGRLLAFCRRDRLDRALAAGTPPESGVALALRAQALTAHDQRVALRSSVETLVLMAGRPAPWASRWAILSARRLDRVAGELQRLAAALSDPGPIDVCGLARVRLLLVDGCGPLYRSAADPVDDLREAIELAIVGLQVQSSSDDRRRSR
ncbi:hypothetical protein FSW04_12250 [Baekduia soli]|uniref:Uncharacterized protein n=1 Tax=Baekduia soli TaxID=496014 RepID=A0A5B8U5Q0_9ACTN|nr:hypothetical protein [Baekduia soli]QEC48261.1 hypothetical protein FSW04_12250 [Baekduia soli]